LVTFASTKGRSESSGGQTSTDHHAVEHQGVLPAFNSQIFLAPADGVAVMTFTNGPGTPSAHPSNAQPDTGVAPMRSAAS
jgi:hypothetical protein